MRIGIDARLYRKEAAGISRYSRNLIKNLLAIESQGLPFGDRKNQYVLFMTPADEREYENSKSQTLNPKQIQNLKIQIVNIPHYSLAEQTKFLKILERENLDLVHFLNFNHPLRYRGKFIVTIHDLTLIYFPQTAHETNFLKRWAFKKVLASAIKNSQKIIVPSKATKSDILKFEKISKDKIQVIPEAADDRTFKNPSQKLLENLKKRYNLTSPVILAVGQWRPHKNISRLLQALEILKKEIPCQLVLLGSGYPVKKREVILPGFVSEEELAAWYRLAAVFVFPSLYEGFGLPGLEAMQAGVPVVASNRSSLPEVYRNAALYFDPLNPTDIADKIKIVLEDENLRDELIKKGKEVAERYSWKKTASDTLDLYKQIQKS